MRQQAPFADLRLEEWCYSCGTPLSQSTRTVEHVPARAFLDRPYPLNLATVYSCFRCNNGTSADELYVACLLDSALVGAVDPALIERERVRRAITGNLRLAERLAAALSSTDATWNSGPSAESLAAVITKLARGHAMYDLADPQYGAPRTVRWFRLDMALTSDVRSFAEWDDHESGLKRLLPEVGSRALLRMFDSREEDGQGTWVTVQDNRYRYGCRADERTAIRLVLRGYLACEVVW